MGNLQIGTWENRHRWWIDLRRRCFFKCTILCYAPGTYLNLWFNVRHWIELGKIEQLWMLLGTCTTQHNTTPSLYLFPTKLTLQEAPSTTPTPPLLRCHPPLHHRQSLLSLHCQLCPQLLPTNLSLFKKLNQTKKHKQKKTPTNCHPFEACCFLNMNKSWTSQSKSTSNHQQKSFGCPENSTKTAKAVTYWNNKNSEESISKTKKMESFNHGKE